MEFEELRGKVLVEMSEINDSTDQLVCYAESYKNRKKLILENIKRSDRINTAHKIRIQD